MKKSKLDNLSYNEKVLYFAGAKRATVGTISQIVDRNIVSFFVGKLRGMIVSTSDGQYKFTTKEEAISCAREFRSWSNKIAREMGLI